MPPLASPNLTVSNSPVRFPVGPIPEKFRLSNRTYFLRSFRRGSRVALFPRFLLPIPFFRFRFLLRFIIYFRYRVT